MMRILVTGRDGQLARSLAERNDGHQLIFASRPEFDLADPISIERVILEAKPDLIVSAAAYTAVDRAEIEAELAMTVNGEGIAALGIAARKIGAPVLHLSTDYVYDGQLDRPYRESDLTSPVGVYGRSKLAGERGLAASGASFAILRTAWVYSPFGNNFVKTMLRIARDQATLNIVRDQHGCPTSALDIADALMVIAKRWEAEPAHGAGQVYHCAGTGEATWAELARETFATSAALGGPVAEVNGIPSSEYPTKAVRPANSRLDCGLLERIFAFRARPWRTALYETVKRLLGSETPGTWPT